MLHCSTNDASLQLGDAPISPHYTHATTPHAYCSLQGDCGRKADDAISHHRWPHVMLHRNIGGCATHHRSCSAIVHPVPVGVAARVIAQAVMLHRNIGGCGTSPEL